LENLGEQNSLKDMGVMKRAYRGGVLDSTGLWQTVVARCDEHGD